MPNKPVMPAQAAAAGPLAGLKVIELGQLIAGPFAAKTLADFGAEVIKVCATAGVLSFDATLGAQQLSEAELQAIVASIRIEP